LFLGLFFTFHDALLIEGGSMSRWFIELIILVVKVILVIIEVTLMIK